MHFRSDHIFSLGSTLIIHRKRKIKNAISTSASSFIVEVPVVLKRVEMVQKTNLKLYLQGKLLNVLPLKMFRHVHADECNRKTFLSPNTVFDIFNPNCTNTISQPDYFIVASSLNGDQLQIPTSHSPMEVVQLCQDIPLRLGQFLGNSSSLHKIVNSIQIEKFYVFHAYLTRSLPLISVVVTLRYWCTYYLGCFRDCYFLD